MIRFVAFLVGFLVVATQVPAGPIRLKDLVEFDGVRGNDLVGYGLVVGLNGSGDGIRNAPFTDYAVQLATFSGVEQQVRTMDLLAALGQQMGLMGLSQMAGWVGMEARVAAPAYFDGSPMTVFAPPNISANSSSLVVTDSAGQEVDRVAIGSAGGQMQWAGVASDGSPFPAGVYEFKVESQKDGDVVSTVPAQVYAEITEAKSDNGVPTVVLVGGSEIAADLVTGIRQPG